MKTLLRWTVAAAACVAASVLAAAQQPALNLKTVTQDELFTTTRIWDAHVRFTPDQWKALDPIQAAPPRSMFVPGEPLVGGPGLRNGFRTVQTGLEFQYAHGDLELGGAHFKDVGARFKGNATYNQRSVREELAQDRPQQIRKGTEAGRRLDAELPQRHLGTGMDERGAELLALS